MEMLTASEMCERLKVGRETFRKAWRSFPHRFVGQGTDLRSARFLWDVQAMMEACCGNQEIQDGKGAAVSRGGVRRRGKGGKSRRVQDEAGSSPVGIDRKELAVQAARFGLA